MVAEIPTTTLRIHRFLLFARARPFATFPPSYLISVWRHAVMTRQELSSVVHELLEKETGETYPGLQESTSLREGLNLDSLDMAGLVLHVESRFGIQIETELLEDITTVGDLLDVLDRKIVAKASRQAA